MFRRTLQGHREWLLLLSRYGLAGLFGAALQTFTLYVWVSVLGLRSLYLWGAALGLCISLVLTFLLQKFWTFKDHGREGVHVQFASYTLVALLNLFLNTLLLHSAKSVFDAMGLDFFRLWYLLAQIVIVAFVSAVSFFANFFITFRSPRNADIV